MTDDLRTQRTHQALVDALVELAQDKSMLKLTVRELADAARINRATFYRHYASVPAFVDALMDELLDGLVDAHELQCGSGISEENYYRSWLEFAKENRALFAALLSANGAPQFERRLVQNGVESWSYVLRPGRVAVLDEVQGGYVATYVTSAHVGVLRRWLDGGCAESVDDMCAILYRLSVRGVFAACGLGQADELPY